MSLADVVTYIWLQLSEFARYVSELQAYKKISSLKLLDAGFGRQYKHEPLLIDSPHAFEKQEPTFQKSVLLIISKSPKPIFNLQLLTQTVSHLYQRVSFELQTITPGNGFALSIAIFIIIYLILIGSVIYICYDADEECTRSSSSSREEVCETGCNRDEPLEVITQEPMPENPDVHYILQDLDFVARVNLKSVNNKVQIINPNYRRNSTKALLLDYTDDLEVERQSSVKDSETPSSAFSDQKDNLITLDNESEVKLPRKGTTYTVESITGHSSSIYPKGTKGSINSNIVKADLNFVFNLLHPNSNRHKSSASLQATTIASAHGTIDNQIKESILLLDPRTSTPFKIMTSPGIINPGTDSLGNVGFASSASKLLAPVESNISICGDISNTSILLLVADSLDIPNFTVQPQYQELLDDTDDQISLFDYFDTSMLLLEHCFDFESEYEKWVELLRNKTELRKECRKIFDDQSTIADKVKSIEILRFLVANDHDIRVSSLHKKKKKFERLIEEHISEFINVLYTGNYIVMRYVILLLRDYITNCKSNQIEIEDYNRIMTGLIEENYYNKALNEIIESSLFSIMVALHPSMLSATIFFIFNELLVDPILDLRKVKLMLQGIKFYICFNKDILIEQLNNAPEEEKIKTGVYQIMRCLCNTTRIISVDKQFKGGVSSITENSLQKEIIDFYLLILEVFIDSKSISKVQKIEFLDHFVTRAYSELQPLIHGDPRQLRKPSMQDSTK